MVNHATGFIAQGVLPHKIQNTLFAAVQIAAVAQAPLLDEVDPIGRLVHHLPLGKGLQGRHVKDLFPAGVHPFNDDVYLLVVRKAVWSFSHLAPMISLTASYVPANGFSPSTT